MGFLSVHTGYKSYLVKYISHYAQKMCAEMEIKMEIQLWKEILEPYGQAVDELDGKV